MFDDICFAKIYRVAHQSGHQKLCFCRFFYRHLNHFSSFGIESSLPELFGVHFAQAFITLNFRFPVLFFLFFQFFVGIKILGFVFLGYAVQWRHTYVHVSLRDKFAHIATE